MTPADLFASTPAPAPPSPAETALLDLILGTDRDPALRWLDVQAVLCTLVEASCTGTLPRALDVEKGGGR